MGEISSFSNLENLPILPDAEIIERLGRLIVDLEAQKTDLNSGN